MFRKNLINLADTLKTSYQLAKPFPHIAIDDLFDEQILNQILTEISQTENDANIWKTFNHPNSGLKRACWHWGKVGSVTKSMHAALISEEFITFLRTLSGISNLEPDLEETLEGGGITQIGTGGFLNIHADFNYHRTLKKYRRLNLLLYLNKDWKEEYGGSLELWNREVTVCEAKFVPHFNKCVLFNTDDVSYHGNTDRINEPNGRPRQAITAYYYSVDKADNMASDFHSTLYQQKK